MGKVIMLFLILLLLLMLLVVLVYAVRVLVFVVKITKNPGMLVGRYHQHCTQDGIKKGKVVVLLFLLLLLLLLLVSLFNVVDVANLV